MKKFIFPLIVSLAFFISSCSNDSDNDVGPNDPPPTNNVTYANVAPIMSGNCYPCHANPRTGDPGPMSLTTLAEVKSAIETRSLIGQIENGTMPKNASMLSNNQIKTIKDWRDGGFKQ